MKLKKSQNRDFVRKQYAHGESSQSIPFTILYRNPLPRKSPVTLAVERPELAALELIEHVCVQAVRIRGVIDNRDNHATFRNICRLSDKITHLWCYLRPWG